MRVPTELYPDFPDTTPEPPTDGIVQFCQGLKLGLDTFTFQGREWLYDIVQDEAQTICCLKSRQIGWSVTLAALIAWYALKYPGIQLMYCTMKQEQFRYFSRQRLRPFFSAHNITIKKDEDRIKSFQLPNGSLITLISGHDDFAQSRGYSIDVLFLDEAELLPLHALINIRETMSMSKIGRMYIGGTGGMQGSAWETYWKKTTQAEWQDGTWRHAAGTINGYHITQRMLPNWTQASEDQKRIEASPAEFAMEVLGEFTAGLDLPLDRGTVTKCMTDTDWLPPNTRKGRIIASLDLAGGGDADTVLAISEYHEEHLQVLYAERMDDRLTASIYPKIQAVLQQYTPDDIVSDAGGNNELLHRIKQDYTITSYRMGNSKEPIIYKPASDEIPISKSFFIQKTISRFHAKKITIPNAEPWVMDQLTSETSETIYSRDGGSYIRFNKMPGRKDDLLMALTFAECAIYTTHDPNNPRNFVPQSYIV